MSLVGKNTQAIIYQKIVTPVVVIDRIYAYRWQHRDSNNISLCLHIMSDCGSVDTVVRKLYTAAESLVLDYMEYENPEGPKTIKWIHSKAVNSIPAGSQLVYRRPAIEVLAA